MSDPEVTQSAAPERKGISFSTVLGLCAGSYLAGVVVGAYVATKNSPCAQHADDATTVSRVARASAQVREKLNNSAPPADAPAPAPAEAPPVAAAAPPPAQASSPGPTAPPLEEPKPDLGAPMAPMTLPARTLPTPKVPMPLEPVRAPVVTDEPASVVVAEVPTNGARPRRPRGKQTGGS
jgi:hypothetical protein